MLATLDGRPRGDSPETRRELVAVTISALGREVRGSLLGLSRGGAQVRATALFPSGTWAAASLRCSATGEACDVDAMIRTARPDRTGAGGWLLGLTFREPLLESSFADFRLAGAPERRGGKRTPLHLATTARIDDAAEETPVELIDLGDGGCCIVGTPAWQIGQKVHLNLMRGLPPLPVAEIVWIEQLLGRNMAGCRFL